MLGVNACSGASMLELAKSPAPLPFLRRDGGLVPAQGVRICTGGANSRAPPLSSRAPPAELQLTLQLIPDVLHVRQLCWVQEVSPRDSM